MSDDDEYELTCSESSSMDCEVLSNDSVLELRVKVHLSNMQHGLISLESKDFTFHNEHIFRAKHIAYKPNYNYNSGSTVHHNIVAIRVQKVNKKDTAVYQMKLSCPELQVLKSFTYHDDNHWHIVNENTKNLGYTFTLTIQMESYTTASFSVLYEDEQLTDFKLKAQDGEISIHRTLLAATSAHFKSILISQLSENKDFLEIPETTLEALEDFKACIYNNILPDDNLEELLLLATYFKIKWLEYKCIEKMLSEMSSGCAIKLFEFVLKHKHMPLFLGIMEQVQCGNLKMSMIRKHYLQD